MEDLGDGGKIGNFPYKIYIPHAALNKIPFPVAISHLTPSPPHPHPKFSKYKGNSPIRGGFIEKAHSRNRANRSYVRDLSSQNNDLTGNNSHIVKVLSQYAQFLALLMEEVISLSWPIYIDPV